MTLAQFIDAMIDANTPRFKTEPDSWKGYACRRLEQFTWWQIRTQILDRYLPNRRSRRA